MQQPRVSLSNADKIGKGVKPPNTNVPFLRHGANLPANLQHVRMNLEHVSDLLDLLKFLVGFDVPADQINLQPELRWKKGPAAFGSTLI